MFKEISSVSDVSKQDKLKPCQVINNSVDTKYYGSYAKGVQGLDRYAYSYNNPIKYNDLTGHCPLCVTALVGAVIGGVIG